MGQTCVSEVTSETRERVVTPVKFVKFEKEEVSVAHMVDSMS